MFGTKDKRACFRHKEPAWERMRKSQRETGEGHVICVWERQRQRGGVSAAK